MPFKPGNKLAKGGRPDKEFADAVRLVVSEDDGSGKNRRKLRRLAEKLYELALAGEGWAMCQIADRLDGKPAQEATITHEHKNVGEMTDQELAERIAELRGTGTADGNVAAPVDPSKLN
jgi:hypothetical protein